MASQQQLRESITDQIIAALESGGVPPWRRPWRVGPNAGSPANVVSRKAYRGINPLLLELASARHGLTSKWWATFNQWKQLGGKVMPRPSHVPSGRWGTQIVFWSPITKTVKDHDGEEEEDRFFVMRTYTVFNVDQVEGDHLDHLRAGRGDRHRRCGRHRLRARRGGHRRHRHHASATAAGGRSIRRVKISSRCRRRRRSPSRTSTTRRSSTNSSTPPSTRAAWTGPARRRRTPTPWGTRRRDRGLLPGP